ncbi:hypothetical protein SMACR_03359 [Sordaria macrospora]|uniref:WGS project CABT00000000 data, contig 2.10 n=2 Tax=Sordaria macrospora TaxID=5147 RepID=F7VWN5_SORMK|nr:uncharacterized protein SMAC_03359 [Sordaria macrospora k-hell]KAA8632873.1 hypothetical protein SMACR_03359 [Sordaria macrospora]WPJ66681.1 hypothetical protein SMAC4_03359 [Sordaria macrospora]CCC09803.1 unnamed protein product [Sordaria macrospora k-hell]
MQPFLSGGTTLALLLITLTLLLFAAAGDEHPYEPYHHKSSVGNSNTERSSVELDTRPPVQVEELVVRLDALKQTGNLQRGTWKKKKRRTEVVRKGGVGYGFVSHRSNPLSSPSPSPSPTSLTSRLPSRLPSRFSRFRPRNLQILAALLSHQSLHTTPLSTPLSLSILKSDMEAAEGSWALGGGGLRGLGLPLAKTVRRQSLQCHGGRTWRGDIKYITRGTAGEEEQRQLRGGELEGDIRRVEPRTARV